MRLLTDAPAWIFNTMADAEKAAAELANGETEGWTYTPLLDPKGSDRCTIEIRDENGEFVSKLTR